MWKHQSLVASSPEYIQSHVISAESSSSACSGGTCSVRSSRPFRSTDRVCPHDCRAPLTGRSFAAVLLFHRRPPKCCVGQAPHGRPLLLRCPGSNRRLSSRDGRFCFSEGSLGIHKMPEAKRMLNVCYSSWKRGTLKLFSFFWVTFSNTFSSPRPPAMFFRASSVSSAV